MLAICSGHYERNIEAYLSNIDFPGVHELQDGGEMSEGNIFQDDDGVLGRVLLQQILEIRAARRKTLRQISYFTTKIPAGTQDHLVGLGVLALSGNGDVTERLLVPQVFEGGHHVGLEIIPAETELLVTLVSRHLENLKLSIYVQNPLNLTF